MKPPVIARNDVAEDPEAFSFGARAACSKGAR